MSGQKAYWARLSKAERAAEMKRRLEARQKKTAALRRQIKSLSKTAKRDPAKQKIYHARHDAKAKGIAPPPLPAAES